MPSSPSLLPRRFSSLRAALIVPYIGLLLTLTLLLVGLFSWSGTRAVATLTDNLLLEMVQRIRLSVDQHLNRSSAVLEVAFPTGLTASPSLASMRDDLYRRFWAATAIHTNPNDYVYYGNTAGQGYGLKRIDSRAVELRVKLDAAARRQYYEVDGIYGEPRPTHLESTVFDPRVRPWYTRAQQADQQVWTPVYIDFNLRDLVMTRARRVETADGQFAGVVATDVALHELESFMRGLELTEHAHAFIMEPNGALIASSRIANLRPQPDGTLDRVNATEGTDPIVQAVHPAIQQLFLQPGHLGDEARTLTVKGAEGERLYVALARIRDDAGLDWVAAVAVPSDDIQGGIRRSLLASLLIGLAAAGVLVLFGLRFFNRVGADIAELTHAARQVGRGELNVDLHADRQDEFGELARSFKDLHTDLFTDRLTGIGNRSALNQLLGALLTRQPVAPFAVLFLDLNGFKPLNDHHGHDNGDLALCEVAQRLRQSVRADDFVARLGGDEFVVVLRHVTDQDAALGVAQHLRQVIAEPLTSLLVPVDVRVVLGCAIGLALYPEDGEDAATLLKRADQAMYQDKAAQRAARGEPPPDDTGR